MKRDSALYGSVSLQAQIPEHVSNCLPHKADAHVADVRVDILL